MPTKRNKAGKQQPYVPAGNGDASGEYGTHATGGNIHYKGNDEGLVKTGGGNETKNENSTPIKQQPTNAERNNLLKRGIVTDDMKNADYTNQFCETVKISRQSLSKDEIGAFNAFLQKTFNEYPNMQRFKDITVRNNTASHTGGYILTETNYKTHGKSYSLYINSGWLEDRQAVADDKTINWYQTQVDWLNKQLEKAPEADKDLIKTRIENFETTINGIKRKRAMPKTEFNNVINRCSTREERLNSLMAHEIMHRITQDFEDAVTYETSYSNPELYKKHIELSNKIRDVFNKALTEGDARKISRYATTNSHEFLSEANAMLEGNFEMPQYIKDLLLEVKDFNREIKA